MATSKDRPILAVSAINRQTVDWTALVQVVERHRIQVGTEKNGKPGKRYRRYVFVDEHGTKVSAIVFESDINFFEQRILPFKRYKIAKAGLIDAYAFFKVSDYPFTWVLDYRKLVDPLPEEVPPCLPFTHTVCPFTDFFRHADAESYFDVKAIVVHAFPLKEVDAKSPEQVKPKSFQRDLVIIDERKIPLIMTLWDDFANEEGLQIANLFPAITIIIAQNVKATTFHGLSLSTRKYSYLLINPPLPDSLPLRSWCHDNKDEIDTMLKNKTYEDPSVLFPAPAASDVITVSEALSRLPVRKTAWVIGKPKFNPTKYKLWTAACEACNSATDIPIEWLFDCSVCGSADGFYLRSSVPIQLTEGENMLSVTLRSPDVQILTNVTPQNLKDSDEFGLNTQEELKVALEKLTVVCFLRSNKKKNNEAELSEPVRYTSVKAYDAAVIGIGDNFTSPTKEHLVPHDASAEKQLFTPTFGNFVKEVEAKEDHAEHSARTLSAKRSIAFVSQDAISGGGGRASMEKMKKSCNNYKDVLLPLISMVAMECANVGLNTLYKAATVRGLSHHVFVIYSYALAAVLLLPFSFHRSRSRPLPPMNFSIMWKIILSGLIGGTSQIMGYTGIKYSSPTLASAISNLVPAFTFILAIIFRMETVTLRRSSSLAKVCGTAISISGAFVVTLYKGPTIISSQSSMSSRISILQSPQSSWILGSLFLTVEYVLVPMWYIVQAQIMKEYPGEITVVCYYNFCVAILATIVGIFSEPDLSKWKIRLDISLAAIVCSGIFGSFLNNAVHTWVLRVKGPVYVTMFKPLSIAIAVAMGVIILGDTLYLGSVIGAGIIATGFYTVMWGKATEEKEEYNATSLLESSTTTTPLLQHQSSRNRF